MKIGILGGSFNPAHEGHLHITKIALKKLGLKQVWWLVSPQNPLKSSKDMLPFNKRFLSAKKVAAGNPKIKVLDIESKLGTIYTIDILKRLKQKFPNHEFYWLMGADNLLQLPKWKKWEELAKYANIHVFDREELAYQAICGKAFRTRKVTYHRIRKSPFSSSKIRTANSG